MENGESFMEKLQELLTDLENETGQCSFTEEMIEKVMQEFYKEITSCSPPSPTPSSNDGSFGLISTVAESSPREVVMVVGTEEVSSSVVAEFVVGGGGGDEFVGFGVVGEEEEKKMEDEGVGFEDGVVDFDDDEWGEFDVMNGSVDLDLDLECEYENVNGLLS